MPVKTPIKQISNKATVPFIVMLTLPTVPPVLNELGDEKDSAGRLLYATIGPKRLLRPRSKAETGRGQMSTTCLPALRITLVRQLPA
jgi:hypothetical protein